MNALAVVISALGMVFMLGEANWIILGCISFISILIRVILMLLSPGGWVWNDISVPPVGMLGVLWKHGHAWIAGLHLLISMVLVMTLILLMVLLGKVLLVVALLSKGHGPAKALRNVSGVILLVDELWVLGVEPAALARVVKIGVVELLSLGEALWDEGDAGEAVALHRFRKLDRFGTIQESGKAECLLG